MSKPNVVVFANAAVCPEKNTCPRHSRAQVSSCRLCMAPQDQNFTMFGRGSRVPRRALHCCLYANTLVQLPTPIVSSTIVSVTLTSGMLTICRRLRGLKPGNLPARRPCFDVLVGRGGVHSRFSGGWPSTAGNRAANLPAARSAPRHSQREDSNPKVRSTRNPKKRRVILPQRELRLDAFEVVQAVRGGNDRGRKAIRIL